ncbi:hypothetical protein FTUN_0756 [Frigoriglobus tundricola]|uniref:Uncharacterized protein n=1 Tax=Frigoriglobus tundricola TaxID=2774151 RepID=A0A6M5YIU7_9BACT|nr:hypothetical protein FTUN_0756 [Frigoriglobus tundricola]
MDIIARYKELLRSHSIDTHTAATLLLAEVVQSLNLASTPEVQAQAISPPEPQVISEALLTPTSNSTPDSLHFRIPIIHIHIVPPEGHTNEVV